MFKHRSTSSNVTGRSIHSNSNESHPTSSNVTGFATTSKSVAGRPILTSTSSNVTGRPIHSNSNESHPIRARKSGIGKRLYRTDTNQRSSLQTQSLPPGGATDRLISRIADLPTIFDEYQSNTPREGRPNADTVSHIQPIISSPAIRNSTSRGGADRQLPYSPGQASPKRKHLNRTKKGLIKYLNKLSRFHPEAQFFFYGRFSNMRNMMMVSNQLQGIDKSRQLQLIHQALDDYSGSVPIHPQSISFTDRFPTGILPTPSYVAAFDWFVKTQSAKSMKPIHTYLRVASIVPPKVNATCTVVWYRSQFQELFQPSSRITALQIWKALSSFTYYGSVGLGKPLKELTRKHYIGLLQSLDLLAAARNEARLPMSCDMAGNPITPVVPSINAGWVRYGNLRDR